MLRISREIARDVARLATLPLVQIVALRGPACETLAAEGTALSTQSLRGRITDHLRAGTALDHLRAFASGEPPARMAGPCEPALAALLFPDGSPGHVLAWRIGGSDEEPVVLRAVLAGKPRGTTLRTLDGAARLAAGQLEAHRGARERTRRTAAFRAFQEGAGEAIFVADGLTGRLEDVNQRLCELTGRGRAELLSLDLTALVVHPLLDAPTLFARIAKGPVVRDGELRLLRRRGEPVPIALTAARLDLDGRAVLHVIARDVTRERRALQDLAQARDTLAALHVAGAHLSIETDDQAIYGVLARELSRLGFHCGVLGPPLDGGSGLQWRFLSFQPPLRAAIERALGRPLAALRIDPLAAPLVRRCFVERRTVHTDRARRPVLDLLGGATTRQIHNLGRLVAIRRVILAPLRREGRPVGVLAVAAAHRRTGDPEAIDAFALQASIALEKARLFTALREERARLETEVDRRTRELRAAVAALEATDRRKDNFLANISHELRTPLVTVLGYSDLLSSDKLGDLTPRQRTAAQVIGTSARRLKGFIEELLELSRHELTEQAYHFGAFEVGEVLTQAVIALAPRFSERGLRVRARVARGTPRVYGDRDRIQQVLVNLLANAERYSPDGAAIRIAAARVRPGRIEIAVSDRGAGIPDEHLAHIFDRLYQVRDDHAPRHKGGALGIGLAIVKGIVEAHGGEVTVRSRVGRGTTFRFSLAAAVPEDAAEPEPEAGAGAG